MSIILPDPPGPTPPTGGGLEWSVKCQNTAAFIAADPMRLALTPYEHVTNDAGGFVWVAGEERTEETFRLIPGNDRMPEVRTSSGRLAQPVYVLLGTYDSAMQQWDRFKIPGDETTVYEIASAIRPKHTLAAYERKGDVVVYTET